MSKHTPGPWAIVNREIRGPAESGVIVARIPEWGVAADAPDPFAANARLIVAAPDLLEALTDLRRRFHAACLAGGSDGWAADASCAKADAAIAKAEGTA